MLLCIQRCQCPCDAALQHHQQVLAARAVLSSGSKGKHHPILQWPGIADPADPRERTEQIMPAAGPRSAGAMNILHPDLSSASSTGWHSTLQAKAGMQELKGEYRMGKTRLHQQPGLTLVLSLL